MFDLKKMLALGAVCTLGVIACDTDEEDAADGGPTCTVGDATVDPICATDDAGVENCVCPGEVGGAGGAGGAGGTGGVGGAVVADPHATAVWSDDDKTLTLTITEGAANGPYQFGLAETGNGTDGWMGEDCLEDNVCRSVPTDGILVLTSVHPTVGGEGVDAIDETHTLLHGGLEAGLGYYLHRDSAENEGCWTWGHAGAAAHWVDLGCNPLPL